MQLLDLQTFVHVAERGTLTAAAGELGVPTSTVSRRVRRLEDDLGVQLLTRASRSFVLSDDGQALHRRAGPLLRELGEVVADLADGASRPRGLLSVTLPIDLASSAWLAGLFASFSDRHADVRVRLLATNRAVDLADEGVDVALRMHRGQLPARDDLVARRLALVRLARYAASDTSPTLAHALEGQSPRIEANDYGPLAALVLAGAGSAALPEFLAEPLVAEGRLCRIGDVDAPPATLSAVWPRSRHLAPRVRAFIDHAVNALG